MLWSVFEGAFARKGLLRIGCCPLIRFKIKSMAKASWCFRAVLCVGEHTSLGDDFTPTLKGFVRLVRTLTDLPELEIRDKLGMREEFSGRAFLRFVRQQIEKGRKWDEPYPFDLVLAGIARELYKLHAQQPSGPIDQRKLIEKLFDKSDDGGKATYERVVILPVNFDFAFQRLDKYGLAPAPAVSYAQQIAEVEQLATDPVLLQKLEDLAEHKVELRPFLCVDPRHQPPGGLDAWVKSKVNLQNGPFYGLKLYPPMGFRPTDPRLKSILEWCKAGAIPITSHCSMGGAGLRGLEERGDFAHPRYWRHVIQRLGTDGVLRLNLAHFSDLTRSLRTEAAQTWSDEIIRLMYHCQEKRHDVEIYSDLSYAWVESDWETFEENVEKIEAKGLGKWMLFGSDWWNYLPDCKNEEDYLKNLKLGELGGILRPDDLEENAKWFLGLRGTARRFP